MLRFILLFLFGNCLFHSGQCENGNSWTSLHVKWGPSTDPVAFSEQPITRKDAEAKGWKKLERNDTYKGDRYVKDNDYTVVLIFGRETGKLVGFQTQYPDKYLDQSAWHRLFETDNYNKEIKDNDTYYVVTMYTINPTHIDTILEKSCNRPAGCGLWFQRGKDPEAAEQVPSTINGVQRTNLIGNSDVWTRMKCTPTMGLHYVHWNATETADCNVFPPYFTLYVESKLSGFVWAHLGNTTYSPYLEPRARSEIPLFYYVVPTCFVQMYDDAKGATSIHVYFNDKPQEFVCSESDSKREA